jgi:AcrR family transcriptional regulator
MGGAGTTDPANRKKRRPHRRDEILAAALQLFEEKGYHATGMDDIGAVAGMTGPAIYRHFRNKEELLETLLLEHTQAFLERAQAIAAGNTDPAEIITGLVDAYVDALLANPGLAVVAAYERRNLRPELTVAISKAELGVAEEWLRALAELQPDRPPAELRAVVQGVTAMAVAMASSRRSLSRAAKAPLMRRVVLLALEVDDAER